MTIRRLRGKQGGPKCSYCTERADWRGVYFTMFACAEHLPKLEGDDSDQAQRDSYQSDAEWSLGI